MEEADFDIVPVFPVNMKNVQLIPPSLGSASEDADQLLDFSLFIPGSDVGGNLESLHESAAGQCSCFQLHEIRANRWTS
jgi:hypothetical protein